MMTKVWWDIGMATQKAPGESEWIDDIRSTLIFGHSSLEVIHVGEAGADTWLPCDGEGRMSFFGLPTSDKDHGSECGACQDEVSGSSHPHLEKVRRRVLLTEGRKTVKQGNISYLDTGTGSTAAAREISSRGQWVPRSAANI
jgi:hypothetical protein